MNQELEFPLYARTNSQIEAFELAARHGKSCILVGPSGTGKTTVLKDIVTWLGPEKAAVAVDWSHFMKLLRYEDSLVVYDCARLMDIPIHIRPSQVLIETNYLPPSHYDLFRRKGFIVIPFLERVVHQTKDNHQISNITWHNNTNVQT